MKLPHLIIGNLDIYPPIVQGGMGIKVSLGGLASAVANCGGVGTISAAIRSDHLRDRKEIKEGDEADVSEFASFIRDAKANTQGVVGVNIMCALTSFTAMVNVAVREKADIIFSGAGLPLTLPKLVEGSDIKTGNGEIKFICSYLCLKSCDPKTSPYCIANALTNAAQGHFDEGFVFVGANVGRINKIVSVRELITELVTQAESV